jgi:hypothetical protein
MTYWSTRKLNPHVVLKFIQTEFPTIIMLREQNIAFCLECMTATIWCKVQIELHKREHMIGCIIIYEFNTEKYTS